VGQLTNVDYATDTDVVFGFDTLGRLVSRTDAAGAWSWAYDAASSRVLTNVTPFAPVIYSYAAGTYELASVGVDASNKT
jgi:YD repeat-containing protein